MELLREIAEAIQGFMDSGPPFLLTFVYLFLIGIPVVLWHELGHAAAAVRLLDEDVDVSVGTAGKLGEARLGRIALSINAISDPRGPAGLATVDDSRATARDVFLIAMAGPLMSLVGLVLSAWALAVVPPGVLHDLLWACTAMSVILVLNVIPFEFEERRGGPRTRTDGRLALDAVKVLRELRY